MVRPQCENRNRFCLVCGLLTSKKNSRNVTDTIENQYESLFKLVHVKDWYKPEILCLYCRNGLQKQTIKYSLPIQWLYRTEHSEESCYFCINWAKANGFHRKNREKMTYSMVDSVLEPVLNSKTGQTEEDQQMNFDMSMDDEPDAAQPSTSANRTPPRTASKAVITSPTPPSAADTSSTFQPARRDVQMLNEPILITQKDFDNLVKELNLSKSLREKLGSRLADHNLMAPDFHITAGRKRRQSQEFDELFRLDEETQMTYCWNIRLLFIRIKHPHVPQEWRLFIDGGKDSLKAVLLHNTNVYPSIPIAHGDKVKETYENIGAILKLIQYDEYKWQICADLKIVAILMGLTGGYAKHQCFLCLWEGRKNELHYDYNHKWPPRNKFRIGINSQEKEPLLRDQSKIILPPLHIKLGLVRNFTMALPRNGAAYECLMRIMNKLGVSAAKVCNGKNHFDIF